MDDSNLFFDICFLLSYQTYNDRDLKRFLAYTDKDWERLITIAQYHGVLQLLYTIIHNDQAFQIPSLIKEKIFRSYLLNTSRNIRLLHSAASLIEIFNSAEIPTIVLKGVYLSENIYEDTGLRVVGDVDLLIKETDIHKIMLILREQEYEVSGYFDRSQDNFDLKHIPPVRKAKGPSIELHWHIIEGESPFKIDVNSLWASSIPCVVNNIPSLGLGLEDLILHLCIHLAYQHRFGLGLRSIYDVYEVLRKKANEVNWQNLFSRAKEWHATRCLFLTLDLVRKLFNLNDGSEIFFSGEKLELEKYSQLIIEYMISTPSKNQKLTPDLANLIKERNVLKKILLIIRRIFLPRRTMSRVYNLPQDSLKVFPLYFHRFYFLVKEYYRSYRNVVGGRRETNIDLQNEIIRNKIKGWLVN